MPTLPTVTTIGTGETRTSDKPREVKLKLASSGQEVTLRGAEVDGEVLFEGDIVLARNIEELGTGITYQQARWPNRTVIYEIARGVDKKLVEKAIAHWTQNTVMRFALRTNERNYVIFRNGIGCSSSVGMVGGVGGVGGVQFITIGPGCDFGRVVHEIGHTVGLWHEQSRDDRDQHVKIHWDNIEEKYKDNFNQHIADGDDIGPYDYGSIMHYASNAFARDPSKPTITPLLVDDASIGQRNGLSPGDIAAVAMMYANVSP